MARVSIREYAKADSLYDDAGRGSPGPVLYIKEPQSSFLEWEASLYLGQKEVSWRRVS